MGKKSSISVWEVEASEIGESVNKRDVLGLAKKGFSNAHKKLFPDT